MKANTPKAWQALPQAQRKQIEEMARDICGVQQSCNDVCHPINSCRALKYAERAYDAGYRKQSENVIELPCKIGDRIYRLNRLCSAVNEATVEAIYFTEDKKYYPKSHIIIQYDLARGRVRFNFSEFGKTVFLSREEAENALAKMKGGAE